MDQLHLALPKALEHLNIPLHSEEHSFEIITKLYSSPEEVPFQPHQTPLIIFLAESEYNNWVKQLPQDHLSNVGIVMIEEVSSVPLELKEPHQVLAWVDLNLSEKRWKFIFSQMVKKFDNLVRVKALEAEVESQKFGVSQLNEIGTALSSEKSLERLLDLIITNSMELTHADGGSLYLIEEIPDIPEDPNDYFKNKRFRFEVAKNESRNVPFKSFVVDISKKSLYGYVALTGNSLLIEDAYFIDPKLEYSWGGREFDKSINYRTKSILTVPMFDNTDIVIGVVQLINCKKVVHKKLKEPEFILDQVISFTPQHAKAIQSIASQAGVAIQNKRLMDSVQTLFDGFINASVKAIESRDPTTSGHSSRVAALTVSLAEAINFCQTGPFAKVNFTADQIQEIRYASLLHDFGKIGVKEEVLVKSKKLYPHEQQIVADRFNMIRKTMQLNTTQKQLEYFLEKSHEEALRHLKESNKILEEKLAELDDYIKFIIRCNEPTVMAQGGFERLHEIGLLTVNDPNRIISYLQPDEVASLSVPKGSLNEQDRREIESHVTHTYKFLSIIPWTKSLKNVAKIAYAHHEKLDGSGYPLKLKSDEIPLQSKMMTISDIYDALTAWDRPYKKAMPAERALNILEYEAKDNHIDSDLLKLFIDVQLYRLVARPPNGSG